MPETTPLKNLADAGARISNLQERVLELEDNSTDAYHMLRSIERDLASLSEEVSRLGNVVRPLEDPEDTQELVDATLRNVLDYAALRLAANGTANELINLLRESVRYA